MGLILLLVHWALLAFLALLTARAVLALGPLLVRDWEPKGALRVIAEFVLTVTDPPVRFLQRFLPPVRLGDLKSGAVRDLTREELGALLDLVKL